MDGLVILDKPLSISSLSAVKKVQSILGASRAGHIGTLDPEATGVLPVLLGRATRLASFMPEREKKYTFSVRLGIGTETDDAEGRITRKMPVPGFDRTGLEDILRRFTGRIKQIPPLFSAIKVRGQPLYRRARRGERVKAPEREVEVFSLEIKEMHKDGLVLEATCGPGTYIRALARDISEELGTVGHVTSLRRTYSSGFDIHDCITLEGLEELANKGAQQSAVIKPAQILKHLPGHELKREEVEKVRQGQPVEYEKTGGNEELYRLLDSDHNLVCVARFRDRALWPVRVLMNAAFTIAGILG